MRAPIILQSLGIVTALIFLAGMWVDGESLAQMLYALAFAVACNGVLFLFIFALAPLGEVGRSSRERPKYGDR